MRPDRLKKYARLLMLLGVALILSAPGTAAATGSEKDTAKEKAAPDSTMKLEGGKEGTLFESLKVEGEDRIRIEFERPELILSIDSKSAQGLEWKSTNAVLERLGVSLTAPYLRHSAGQRSNCFARPWLDQFSTDGVAHFRPDLKGVDRWKLMVADSKGETVALFEGKGNPPKEIVWDGFTLEGIPAAPGLVYSYVLEAYDKAGNKRNFLGEGFELPSYLVNTPEQRIILFSGSEVAGTRVTAYSRTSALSPTVLEVADFINQDSGLDAPIHIQVTARNFNDAERLAGDVVSMLKPYILGNDLRIQTATQVQQDAPDQGTVVVSMPR